MGAGTKNRVTLRASTVDHMDQRQQILTQASGAIESAVRQSDGLNDRRIKLVPLGRHQVTIGADGRRSGAQYLHRLA